MLYEVNGTEYAVDIVTTPEGEITKVSLLDADCDGIALMPTEAVLEAWEADSLRALVQALVEAMLAKRVPPSLPEGWSWDGNPYDDEGDEVEAVALRPWVAVWPDNMLWASLDGRFGHGNMGVADGQVEVVEGDDPATIRRAIEVVEAWASEVERAARISNGGGLSDPRS